MDGEFTVLIAEDEDRIRLLIKSLIDWDALHLHLVGESPNGADALEVLQQQQVDILITDIRMPGINGLDLAKWINDHMPQTSVIVISGYKQFDYAQDALRLNVVDFLLKPINRNEINKAISKIIQKRSLVSHENPDQQLELQRFRSSLRRQCVQSFLYGAGPAMMSLEEFNEANAMQFQPGDFAAVTVQLYAVPLGLDEYLQRYSSNYQMGSTFSSGLGVKLRDLLLTGLASKAIDMEADFMDDTVHCVVNLSPDARENFIRAIQRCSDMLKEHVTMLQFQVFIGVSRFYSSYSDIPTAFQEALSLFSCKCVLRGQGPVFAKDMPVNTLSLPSLGLENEFRKAAETWDYAQLLGHIRHCFEERRLQIQQDPRLINGILGQIFDALWMAAPNRTQLVPDALRVMKKFLLISSHSLYDLVENCCSLVAGQLDRLRLEAESADSLPIRTIKQYIQQHYADQISLETLADKVQLSAAYLCNVFKTETGETIGNYIQRVRIERSQQLLTSTLMNVSEISNAVGYTDAKYFSRIFRKHLGIRPTEFRYLNRWE